MNQIIISTYNISFGNKILDFGSFGKETYKYLDSNSDVLNNFINDWNARDINDILLPDINQALLTPNSEIENGSTTIMIIIYNDIVDFYDDNGFAYSLPTLDFKEIVIGYRDFLLAPPLNGTRI